MADAAKGHARHVAILIHPDPQSFNAAIAHAYCETVRECGQEAILRDLYAMKFDPVLKNEERPDRRGFEIAPDVRAELEAIEGCDVVALIYPIWFGLPPAMADCVVAGGVEMMSYHAQLAAEDAANGVKALGVGTGNPALQAIHPQSHQGVCADAIAAMEGISRETVDALGLESQRRADIAIREGRFARSLVPVLNEDGSIALDRDEFPRPETTAAILANLKPSFDGIADHAPYDDGVTFRQMINQKYPDLKWQGIHHAGNSSGVVDGASAILLASPDYAARNGWKPRARVVMAANMGDCPTLMLNAPVPAARRVLEKARLRIEDIDLWEINEAFAVVAEKFMRDLGLDRDKVNVNGGACALGHPIGATGPMLIGTLLDELERRDLKRGLVTMCAAGGMAPAIIIERI
jgi:acetyl-CoA C-acetyltransferase